MTERPPWLSDFLAAERLPESYAHTLDLLAVPLADQISGARHPIVVGLCGTQASGKSTLCAVLARLLEMRGLRVAVLSIDDLYLTRGERETLAATVHPLLLTRGPPGTHDVELGLDVIDRLGGRGDVALPRFDKARDTRKPPAEWDRVAAPVDVTLFEGWCVGARPQAKAELTAPINVLERDEDPKGLWRGFINDALAGPYQALYARLDTLVMLKPPSFEVVLRWRIEQEHKLKARLAASGGDMARTMSDEAIARFIAHYERITRNLLEEMPARADLVATLDENRQVVAVRS